jgi:hypothetical protein
MLEAILYNGEADKQPFRDGSATGMLVNTRTVSPLPQYLGGMAARHVNADIGSWVFWSQRRRCKPVRIAPWSSELHDPMRTGL